MSQYQQKVRLQKSDCRKWLQKFSKPNRPQEYNCFLKANLRPQKQEYRL